MVNEAEWQWVTESVSGDWVLRAVLDDGGRVAYAADPTLATFQVRVHLEDRPARPWFGIWLAVHGGGWDPCAEWDMLERVPGPSAYACAMIGDDVAAGEGGRPADGVGADPDHLGAGGGKDLVAVTEGARLGRAPGCVVPG